MIAYYAHSHGSGHLNSAKLFVKNFYRSTVILTSACYDENEFVENQIVSIPNEDTSPEEYQSAKFNLPEYAHYLPKNNPKILNRTREILDIVFKKNIKLALIDVSVETAIIFRMASVPYAYCILPGNRNDQAHQIAFEASEFLYAFFPKQLIKYYSDDLKKKTVFLGFQSKYPFIQQQYSLADNTLIGKSILIICGNGGTKITANVINRIIDRLPHCKIKVIGKISDLNTIDRENYIGFVKNPRPYIENCDMVISSCGLNLTSELLSLKNKFIAIAEDRPYNEQQIMLEALVRHNLAVEFNEDNIKGTIKDYLKLVPPKNLRDWFINPDSIDKVKSKIKKYEAERDFNDHHIS